jgi:hypothetical protein
MSNTKTDGFALSDTPLAKEEFESAYAAYSKSDVGLHNERIRPADIDIFSWLLSHNESANDTVREIKQALDAKHFL